MHPTPCGETYRPQMLGVWRKVAFTLPLGCLTALAAHCVRFGNTHAFGGEANEAIVAAATSGSLAVAVAILYAFLTAGSTTVTGTIARTRVRALLPNAAQLFVAAAACYYGIETLEGNGVELGFTTVLLALFATIVTYALRALCAQLAHFVQILVCELIAQLTARPAACSRAVPQPHPLRAQTLLTARRLGRAPPNERRF